jgi:hypothetical protein
LSIFSSSNTFLLTLFPCAPSILTLPVPTGSLAVLFSFLLSLNLYPDFPCVFVCYPEDTGRRLLEKTCKFLQTAKCHISGDTIPFNSIFRIGMISISKQHTDTTNTEE